MWTPTQLIWFYALGFGLLALAIGVFTWAFFGGRHHADLESAPSSDLFAPGRDEAETERRIADYMRQLRADQQGDLKRRSPSPARVIRNLTEARESKRRPIPPAA
jgi:hypothetical protein